MLGALFSCTGVESVVSGQKTVVKSVYRYYKLSDIIKNINLTLRYLLKKFEGHSASWCS